MSETDGKPRILITRLSALGDCILTLPLACALRDRFPESLLVWAVEPLAASLLSRHAAIDRLMIVPKGWLSSPHCIRSMRDKLLSLRLDWAVDPQSLTKSCMLGWLSGARRRIGFARPQGRELAPWINSETVERGATHIVDGMLRLLEPLGIMAPSVRFDLQAPADAESAVERFLCEAWLTGGYAVINSAASWPSKQWPADRLGRVARHLGEHHELPSVITWAGEREGRVAQEIVAKAGGHALQAPATSLPQLVALMRRARLVIGSDTGPLHLAAAVGTPCVGLYGPTRVEKSGPYGSQHLTIQAEAPVHANRQLRQRDETAIRRISVEQVCAATDLMLRGRFGGGLPRVQAA
jgi:heptosyltransferase I